MRTTLRRALAVTFVLLLVAAGCADDSSDGGGGGGEAAPSQPAPEGIEGVVAIRAPGDRQHVDGAVDYPTRPPIGGDHNAVWANCKFYSEPVPDENVVHSLEHGAVWVAYGPEAPAEELDLLNQRIGSETHLIATPYDGLDTTYVLSAWERQLPLDSLTDPRFDQFLSTYLEGPTTPEKGAVCTGGAG
ncbi:MAG: DUF3105 domain-containing protein [Actinomycetota bacterium]